MIPRKKKAAKVEAAKPLKVKPPPLQLNLEFNAKQPLYAAGWGWNANARAGNNTDVEIRAPRMVQKSTDQNYIACAAGKHHSLLVSTDGNVYSFGEGRQDQLGYGNMFTGKPIKGGIVQAFPKEVTPSGSYKFHRDLKIVEVGAGSSFSLAREACYDEGIATITGFFELETAVSNLLKIYPESASVQKVFSIVRQERYNINTFSEGNVTVWGEGVQGQLGLGYYTRHSLYPQPIPTFYLNSIIITKISVGMDHCLAIDSTGRLFSWGSGRSGKLGQGDFENRYQPELVRFFRSTKVVSCAAGTAHSAVITLQSSTFHNTVTEEMETIVTTRVSTFGRGAHGRLGYGSNRSHNLPVLVSQWLPSLQGVTFHSVACGGAHTLVLAYKPHPVCLANPYGYRTYVAAFGYGANGQLGDGLHRDSFIPVRVKMPKFVIIMELSAGHSWSMCRSIDGRLFTFGKGLRGQLGQDADKFSFVPRELTSAFGSFVRIASGYAHNVGVVVPRRHLESHITDAFVKTKKNIFHRTRPDEYISCRLKETMNCSTFLFDCCRMQNNIRSASKKIAGVVTNHDIFDANKGRFYCHTCALETVCAHCINICHFRHNVTEMDLSTSGADATAPPSYSLTYRFNRHHVRRPKKDLSQYREPLPAKTAPQFQVMSVKVVDILLKDVRDAAARAAAAEAKRANAARKAALKKNKKGGSSASKTGKPVKKSNKSDSEDEKHAAVALQAVKTPTPAAVVPIPACRCGLYNAKCRMLPMIPECPEVSFSNKPSPTAVVKPQRKTSTAAPSAAAVAASRQTGHRASFVQTMTAGVDLIQRASRSIHVPDSINNLVHGTRRDSATAAPTVGTTVIRDPRIEAIKALRAADLTARKQWRDVDRRTVQAVRAFQRVVMKRLAVFHAKKENKEHELIRHEVCKEYFEKQILGTIWGKVNKAFSEFREVRELNAMRYEDDLTHKYVYNQQLQSALIGIEAMKFGVRALFGSISGHLPRVLQGIANTDEWRPTFGFSWNSIRQMQMKLHPLRRLNLTDVALLTQHFPRYQQPGFYLEGQYFDRDISLFTVRYLKDHMTENWRLAMRTRDQQRRDQMVRIAAAALERLNRMKNAAKVAVQAMFQGSAPPPPPKIGPPRKIVVANMWYEKIQQREKQTQLLRQWELMEDAPFDPFKPIDKDPFSHRRRRATISDPTELTGRLKDMRDNIYFAAYTKRRNSLPTKLAPFRCRKVFDHFDPSNLLQDPKKKLPANATSSSPTSPSRKGAAVPSQSTKNETVSNTKNIKQKSNTVMHLEAVMESLDMFGNKLDLITKTVEGLRMKDVVHADEDAAFRKRQSKRLKETMKRILQSSFLSSSVPNEIHSMLLDSERRRSIGEPERVNRQLQIILKTREKFADIVKLAGTKCNIVRRKRSFDFTELKDDKNGISELLGFGDFEAPPRPSTMSSLRTDSYFMEKAMIECGYAEQSIEFSKKEFAIETQMKSMKADVTKNVKQNDKGKKRQTMSSLTKTKGTKKAVAFGASGKKLLDDIYEGEEEEGPDYESSGYNVVIWQEYNNEEGQPYYYNTQTGESVWVTPYSDDYSEVQIQSQYQDDSGRWYWYNNTTRETEYM